MNDQNNERMTKKIGEEDYALLQHYKTLQSDEAKENTRFEREMNIKHNEALKRHNVREIAFKQQQIDSGNVVEVHELYEGNKKPIHHLKTDIEQLELQNEKIDRVIKNTKELIAKDAA